MDEKVEQLYQDYLKEKLDLVFDVPDDIRIMHDGEHKWRLIDSDGKLVKSVIFESIEYFKNGFARVENNAHKMNFINTKGELISDEWFYSVEDFKDGFAVVKNADYKYNYINEKGELISKIWFDSAWDFKNGFAIVEKESRSNFINKNGELISDVWFLRAWDFNEGFAKVMRSFDGDKMNLINERGELISDVWYNSVFNFYGKYALVENSKSECRFNLIDAQGSFISKKWFDWRVYEKPHGIFRIETDDKFTLIDGKYDNKFNKIPWLPKGTECEYADDHIVIRNTNTKKMYYRKMKMGDYQVKKRIFGYVCSNSVDSFKVKYMPVKCWGSRYVLCFNEKDKTLVLYDRVNDKEIFERRYCFVSFDDNFIFRADGGTRVYFFYDDQMIDITEYYNKHIKGKNIRKINHGVKGIVSKDDFCFFEREKIDELFEQVKEEKRRKKELAEKSEIEKQLDVLRSKDVKLEEERKRIIKEALSNLSDSLKILSQCTDESYNTSDGKRQKLNKIPVEEKDFLVKLIGEDGNEHFEISPYYLDAIKYIDLSNIKFDNVDVRELDFRGNDAAFLDPQKVYQKSLRGCNFDKVFISPFLNFSGVDIRGCKFSEDNNLMTFDTFNSTFKDAIYDETTTYNGKPFAMILGKGNSLAKRSR